MKILVADDDPISRLLMKRMLQHNGYEVVTAENGRTAAELLLQNDGPRLALIDWMMPEMDGPAVCRAIRACHDRSYVYILLLTSRQSSEDVVQGLEAGADDYLTKPCQQAELIARLHTGRRVLRLEDKLVEAREEMRFKATHDALTSLWNHGAILSLVKRGLTSEEPKHKPLSVLLCDVDYFKAINDLYGHLVGDEVLTQIGQRLSAAVRAEDEVGRFGGEEFLVMMVGCSRATLRARAEELRHVICDEPFMTQQGPLDVTLSIGAITAEEWDGSGPFEAILKQADSALYKAKAEGRNRVVCTESFVESVAG